MNKKTIIMIALVFLALAIAVYAQVQYGCCCDPSTGRGTFESQATCLAKNFNFIGPPPNMSVTCNQLCNVTAITPPTPVINATQCGSPTYKPAPTNLVARPVKGQKAIKLDFIIPCPANYIRIFRCAGNNCNSNFTDITSGGTAPISTYTDSDSALLWDQPYTYLVMASYPASGDGFNASIVVNTGDIECWNQVGTSVFCISDTFYYQSFIKNYLQSKGYKSTIFADFGPAVQGTFNSFFRKSWFCNDMNRLSRASPAVDCPADKICVSDGSAARCVERIDCDLGGHFGLFPNKANCEGTSSDKKYCFLDKSNSSVDKCYPCDPQMSCFDYHSKSACQSNNCGIGNCVWQDVFAPLGVGVCYDARLDLCPLCGEKYSSTAFNKDGYNVVFDECSEEKASMLSTSTQPCFFNKNEKSGKSCDVARCIDYTAAQCSSPSNGITLNPDNSLGAKSSDPCGINVCQSYTASGLTYCVKNADGSTGHNWQDCSGADNPDACERDYFPPETIPFVSGNKPGKHDYISIIVKDKLSKTSEPVAVTTAETFVCVVSNTTSCAQSSQFTKLNSSKLNINDLDLQDGQTKVGSLAFGANNVKFYSIDKYRNVEVINKSISVFACDECSGPKVLNLTISNARNVNGTYYTNSIQPVITVVFNELAQITASSLTKGPTTVPVSMLPSSGSNLQYTFTPTNALSDGSYSFSLNSVDNNAVYMDDPLVLNLIIDTVPPAVNITPADKTEFDKNTAQVVLSFSEPVLIDNTTLDEMVFVDNYLVKPFPINLSEKLTSSDRKYYSGSISNLREGLKLIKVDAFDYASNRVRVQSDFSVITAAPKTRMKFPSWGVSSSYTFDVVFETSSSAQCKYIYDVPTPPPVDEYDTLANFDYSDGIEHKIAAFNRIPFGDTSKHSIHVYCKTEKFGVKQESFELSVDTSPPVIISNYAMPNPIVESFQPNVSRYMTSLMVQTDKDSFCKYSASTQNFTAMEGVFPGFDELPKTSNSAEVEVNERKNYTYYVACKGVSELVSPVVMVRFYIDLTVPFMVNNTTPRYSKDPLFFLSVNTNKRSFCYFGEDPQDITNCFGNCTFGLGHSQQVTKSSGTHNFYFKCNTGAGSEVSNVTNVTVTVDTSPPVMTMVDDSSTLPGQPDISWYPDKLRVSFLGNDSETAVIKYYYLLETAFARETVINWTPSLNLNGTPIYVKANLTDGTRYIFRVKPVNIVGLEGAFNSSDGVTVDTTKAPPECANGELDAEETDIDCGGSCAGCIAGKSCLEDGDCESLFCLNGTCAPARCDDDYRNGKETDVDCGGADCDKCELEKICAEDSDCISNKCEFGACAVPDPCENGVLDGTESDVDCGGSCPNRCYDGSNCNTAEDCAEGLNCAGNTCIAPRDIDSDGVMDDIDQCLDTPAGEIVDDYGCSLSQTFSCNDEIDDAWRTRHFGEVLCTGDGAVMSDPDNDGLANIDEYGLKTSPVNKDSDDDGWNDGKEISKGTDPLDPDDHPKSLLWSLFKWLLLLALLAGLGFGAYYGYKKGYYDKLLEQLRKKPKEEKPEAKPEEKPKESKPAAAKPAPVDKIMALRKLARKEEEAPEEFVSLEEASKRAAAKPEMPKKKLVEKAPKAEALARLRQLKKTETPSLAKLKQLKKPEQKQDALSKLKKLKKARKK